MYIDPACPWAWLTSRWLYEAEQVRPFEVTTRFFSLAAINRKEGEENPVLEALEKALRVLVAARRAGGEQAVRSLYTALGTAIHEDTAPVGDDVLVGLRDAVTAAGLDPELVDQALADPAARPSSTPSTPPSWSAAPSGCPPSRWTAARPTSARSSTPASPARRRANCGTWCSAPCSPARVRAQAHPHGPARHRPEPRHGGRRGRLTPPATKEAPATVAGASAFTVTGEGQSWRLSGCLPPFSPWWPPPSPPSLPDRHGHRRRRRSPVLRSPNRTCSGRRCRSDCHRCGWGRTQVTGTGRTACCRTLCCRRMCYRRRWRQSRERERRADGHAVVAVLVEGVAQGAQVLRVGVHVQTGGAVVAVRVVENADVVVGVDTHVVGKDIVVCDYRRPGGGIGQDAGGLVDTVDWVRRAGTATLHSFPLTLL